MCAKCDARTKDATKPPTDYRKKHAEYAMQMELLGVLRKEPLTEKVVVSILGDYVSKALASSAVSLLERGVMQGGISPADIHSVKLTGDSLKASLDRLSDALAAGKDPAEPEQDNIVSFPKPFRASIDDAAVGGIQ